MQINIPKQNDYTEKREKESKRFPYTGRSNRIASNCLANGVVSLFTAVCTAPLRTHQELAVTTWNYTYTELNKKEIVCNKFSAETKTSEPFLGRHPLWFDSRKRPPSVSDH